VLYLDRYTSAELSIRWYKQSPIYDVETRRQLWWNTNFVSLAYSVSDLKSFSRLHQRLDFIHSLTNNRPVQRTHLQLNQSSMSGHNVITACTGYTCIKRLSSAEEVMSAALKWYYRTSDDRYDKMHWMLIDYSMALCNVVDLQCFEYYHRQHVTSITW